MEVSPINEISIRDSIDFVKIHKNLSVTQNISQKIIETSLDLLKEGNTVPFIARYRKEATGSLDEIQLRKIQKEYETLVTLENRKLSVLRLIKKLNKLTSDLALKIEKCKIIQEVEDFYLPFKPKIKTLGTKAKEKGLEPLAIMFSEGLKTGTPEEYAKKFIDKEKKVESVKDALDGAIDIIAEEVGSNAESRQYARKKIFAHALLKTERIGEKSKDNSDETKDKVVNFKLGVKKVDPTVYQDYFDFKTENFKLKEHQILALNRAEKLGVIKVNLVPPDDEIMAELKRRILNKQSLETNVFYEYYNTAVEKGYKRYIVSSIKRELRKELLIKAETHAIEVFATNLRSLLMTPPIKQRAIIGLDPGYRTGCKVAVIDAYGKYLDNGVIYPAPPKNQKDEAKKILLDFIKKYNVRTFAIGNGTASRETEEMITELIEENKNSIKGLEYAIVNEAGASIYSASEIAIEEFPKLDLTVRGAISIARRLQDPLSELIKIDPKSIGVGMYQHDVNQRALRKELDTVIEDCVNQVGVNLNSASSKLLEYVSGLNKRISKGIIEFRIVNGPYKSRQELNHITGLGPKAFEQCAGFLKIQNGDNPLDTTFIHPESYETIEKILEEVEINPNDFVNPDLRETNQNKMLSIKPNVASKKLGIEANQIRFLVRELLKPERDPRDELPQQIMRKGAISLDDLKEGMIIQGKVGNVVDFGAFVDIGVKINGLVHKSQIANKYVKNPHEYLAVGDVKDFMIISIDLERKRIQLSLKQVIGSNKK